MIQTCNDEYWSGMESMKPEGAPCGRTYDDFDHSTTCPHNWFPGPSRSEIAAMNEASKTEAQREHERRFPPPRSVTSTRTRTR